MGLARCNMDAQKGAAVAEVRLSQLLAVEKRIKDTALETSKRFWHAKNRPERWSGIHKWFEMKNDADLQIPEERSQVELTADRGVRETFEAFGAELDAVYTRDEANTGARATVYLDGVAVDGLQDLPAVTLLALGKKLLLFAEFVRGLPTLDPNEEWEPAGARGVWQTVHPAGQQRTRRVTTPLLLAEATQHHKAQVQAVESDVPVANAFTRKFHGGLDPEYQEALAESVERLAKAVEIAREEASTHKTERVSLSGPVRRALAL